MGIFFDLAAEALANGPVNRLFLEQFHGFIGVLRVEFDADELPVQAAADQPDRAAAEKRI